jgi:hypothetical protein
LAKSITATEAQPDRKNRHTAGPKPAVEPLEDFAVPGEVASGPALAAGEKSVEAQAGRLTDHRLPGMQRRALAAQIGQVRGNGYLQRVVAATQRKRAGVIAAGAGDPCAECRQAGETGPLELANVAQQSDTSPVMRAAPDSAAAPPAPATATARVTPDQVTVTNNGTGVTADAIQVLKEIVAAIGETSAEITSGRRTPAEQAAAMYTNLESKGVAVQRRLYGRYGDQVIDVYETGKRATPAKDATTIKQEMTDKIIELGPSNVSNHCSNNSVIDVAPSSIRSDGQFQIRAQAHARVTKYLGPNTTPSDPAHHLEIS